MKVTTSGGNQTSSIGKARTYLIQNEGPADLELAGTVGTLGSAVLLPAGMQVALRLRDCGWNSFNFRAPAGTVVRINQIGL